MSYNRSHPVSAIVALALATMALSGQTIAKKDSPPKTDTWQRSKECAAQAEKVMTDKPGSWENHYSPKYNRCFVSTSTRTPGERAGKDFPETVVELIDAFERTALAQWVSAYPQSEGPLNALSCHIGYEPAACAKAISFISEHMKN